MPASDKDGAPYIEHVTRVSRGAVVLVRQHSRSVNADVVAAIGWLHDAVEDTDTDADWLRTRGISDAVLSGVDALTKRPGEDYADAVRRAAGHSVAQWMKIADNLDNSDEARLALLDVQTSALLRSGIGWPGRSWTGPTRRPSALAMRDRTITPVH